MAGKKAIVRTCKSSRIVGVGCKGPVLEKGGPDDDPNSQLIFNRSGLLNSVVIEILWVATRDFRFNQKREDKYSFKLVREIVR